MKEDLSTTCLNKAVTHTSGEFGNPSLRRTSTALWWSANIAVNRPPARLSRAHVSRCNRDKFPPSSRRSQEQATSERFISVADSDHRTRPGVIYGRRRFKRGSRLRLSGDWLDS